MRRRQRRGEVGAATATATAMAATRVSGGVVGGAERSGAERWWTWTIGEIG